MLLLLQFDQEIIHFLGQSFCTLIQKTFVFTAAVTNTLTVTGTFTSGTITLSRNIPLTLKVN